MLVVLAVCCALGAWVAGGLGPEGSQGAAAPSGSTGASGTGTDFSPEGANPQEDVGAAVASGSESQEEAGALGAAESGSQEDAGTLATSDAGDDAWALEASGAAADTRVQETAQRCAEAFAPVGSYATQECAGDAPQVAAQLLRAYQQAGCWRLVQAGYADLLGNVWGCVVMGPDSVELRVVSEKEASGGEPLCQVQTFVWEKDAWQAQLAADGEGSQAQMAADSEGSQAQLAADGEGRAVRAEGEGAGP